MPYRRRGDWIKIKAAARAAGLSDYIVFSRLRSGWTLEKALNTPVRMVRTRAHKTSSGLTRAARQADSAIGAPASDRARPALHSLAFAGHSCRRPSIEPPPAVEPDYGNQSEENPQNIAVGEGTTGPRRRR